MMYLGMVITVLPLLKKISSSKFNCHIAKNNFSLQFISLITISVTYFLYRTVTIRIQYIPVRSLILPKPLITQDTIVKTVQYSFRTYTVSVDFSRSQFAFSLYLVTLIYHLFVYPF